MEEQMKNNKLSKVKGMLTVVMMACMLLTIGGVSSDAEYGLMPWGETVDRNVEELE